MEEYVVKVAHSNPEVADRAVSTIHSKLTAKLTRIEDALLIQGGVFCGHLLHWINERQTQADVSLLAASLKMLKLTAETRPGRHALAEFGGVEFLSAYHRHAPEPLRDLISETLNLLITNKDQDEEHTVTTRSYQDYGSTFEPRTALAEPSTTKLYVKVDMEAHPKVDEHCEFPPVLLIESDEKLLFDLTVSVKFGDEEQAIGALEEIKRRVFSDFPVDCLLQRTDLVKAVTGLASKSSEKQVILVGEKCIFALELLLKNTILMESEIKRPENRPAQFLPRKMLLTSDFTDISYPCLNLEAWSNGTPGNTLSVAGLMELILTSIPLHEPKMLGSCKRLWGEMEGCWGRLGKHPFVVQQILKQFSSALEILDKLEGSYFLHRLSLARMLVPVVKSVPVDMIQDYIPPDSAAGRCLTEFMVFRTTPDEDLLPYLSELDPNGTKDYQFALECAQALSRAQKVKESLNLTTGLPITSVAMYYNTLSVFQGILPALEFDTGLNIAPAVLDLMAFSVVISEDSHMDAKVGEVQGLFLALLTCPLPYVRENAYQSLVTALQDERELGGVGRGSKRCLALAQALNAANILFHILCMSDHPRKYDILTLIQQSVGSSQFQSFLPFITSDSAHDPRASTLLHFLLSDTSDDLTLFWKHVRDIFSVDSLKRKSSLSTLLNQINGEKIRESEMDIREQEDFLGKLEEKGDLEFIELPSSGVNIEDFMRLVEFLTKQSIELTLKHSVLDQIVSFLLIGVSPFKSDHAFPLISFCVESLSLEISGSAPLINRKIVSKSLEIMCVLACNYVQSARKVLEIVPETVLKVVHMTANAYSPIRFYGYYLLFILCFSMEIPRNKVPVPNGITLKTAEMKGKSSRIGGVSVYLMSIKGFKTPFPVAGFAFHDEQFPAKQVWRHVPSSTRVHAYLNDEFSFDFHPALEVNKLGTMITRAEQHGDILDAVDLWVNFALLAPNGEVFSELVDCESAVMRGVISILRVPPTNRVEDALISTLVTALNTVGKAGKRYLSHVSTFDFYVTLGEITQKSLLPLLIEASGIEGRETLICSVFEMVNLLVPMHELRLEMSELKTIRVFSRYQLDVNAQKTSILHLISRVAEIGTNMGVVEVVLETVQRLVGNKAIYTALDVVTAPGTQEIVSLILASCIEHISPYVSPSSFINKHTVKRLLHVCALLPSMVQTDSFTWCLKFTKDREAEIRYLAWSLLRRLLPRSLTSHPSLIEEALMTGFGEVETYGTKTAAIAFLSDVTTLYTETDITSSETQRFLSQLYQQGVISHIKSVLYENAGPCSTYFAALISLLNGLLVLDSAKVIAMCNQLDIWDGIMRLIRPGALAERTSNEKRPPFQPHPSPSDPVSHLTTLTVLFTFTTEVMTLDPQTCLYLLESTHILSYSLQWLSDLYPDFDQSNEQIYSKTVISAVSCLHAGVYIGKGKGSRGIKEEVSYAVIADWLDKLSGSEVRMAISRMMTALLPLFPPENEGERLVLHQIGTFKTALSQESSSDIRDSMGSLISLLLYSDSAKRVALSTGFDKDLCEYFARLANSVYQDEIAKSRPKYLKSQGSTAGKQDLTDLIQGLMVVRAWSAGPPDIRAALAFRGESLGPIFAAFFSLWSLATRHKPLQEHLLMTISTSISESDEAKKACVILQENKQSILSLLIDFTCKPALVSEEMYLLALRVIGNIAANKEARQLLIKSKFAFGLAQRLVKVWTECKDPTVLPGKTLGTVSFLSTFSFYKEGQSMITVRGM